MVWFGLVLVLAEKEHFYMLEKVELTPRQEFNPRTSSRTYASAGV
jgi:hypothetical protein